MTKAGTITLTVLSLTSQQVNVRTPKTIKTVGKTGGIITAGAGTKKIAV